MTNVIHSMNCSTLIVIAKCTMVLVDTVHVYYWLYSQITSVIQFANGLILVAVIENLYQSC